MRNGIILCFRTSDQDALSMACDYWAAGDDAKWLHHVNHLSELHKTNRALLLKDVNRAAIAYDLSSRCSRCNTPSIASSRSGLGQFRGFMSRQLNSKAVRLCPQCDEYVEDLLSTQRDIRLQEEKLAAAEFAKKLNTENTKHHVDSPTLIDAIYLYSVLESSDVSEYGFSASLSFNVISKISGSELIDEKILAHLYKRGLIKLSEDSSNLSLNRPSNKAFVDLITARWQLSKIFEESSYTDLMMQLSETIDRHAPTQQEIQQLWEVVALAECQGKLLYEAGHYRFSNYQVGDKTNHALLYALKDYAIPRVWSIIQSTCKQIAADVQSGRVAAYKAYMYVPNSLIRFCDRATEQGWSVHARSRENWNTEAALTSLFFNRVLKHNKDGFRTLTSKTIVTDIDDSTDQESVSTS